MVESSVYLCQAGPRWLWPSFGRAEELAALPRQSRATLAALDSLAATFVRLGTTQKVCDICQPWHPARTNHNVAGRDAAKGCLDGSHACAWPVLSILRGIRLSHTILVGSRGSRGLIKHPGYTGSLLSVHRARVILVNLLDEFRRSLHA